MSLRILLFLFVLTYLGFSIQDLDAQSTLVKDNTFWNYDVTSSGFISENVNKRMLINTIGIFSVTKNSWASRLVLSYQFGKVASNPRENDFLTYNTFRIHPKAKYFPFSLLGFETSRTRDIDFRWFIGLGGGVRLVEKKTIHAEFTLTTLYDQSKYGESNFENTPETSNRKRNKWRFSPRIKGYIQLQENTPRFEYEAWVQPAFNDIDDYRTYGNFALLVPTIKHLYVRLGWLFTYESVVLEGLPKKDSNISFGFTFKNN